MNLLLITFSFPPAGGVGVLRPLSLAKYLPESGVRVDVLTARNAPAVGRDDSLLRQVPEAVTIHRTWTLDLPFALRKTIKRLLAKRETKSLQPPSAENSDNSTLQKPSLLARIKNLIANLLLPDPQIGWLPFALPAARRIIRKRHIDAVLITVPPFSSVRLAAGLRKSFPELPVIIDFRDEWLTTTLSLVSFNSNQRARAVAERTEAEAVHAATAVVCVTYAAVEELRKRYPHDPVQKFRYVPNGFDDAASSQEETKSTQREPHDRRITLTYIGSVYGSTDPRAFLAALASLSEHDRARLLIRFIGRIENDAYRDAMQALAGTVEMVGFVPQAEALRQLRASDYALLITHDPINVSAKFYDYLGSGIPIIAAVHPQGEVRRLLEETGAGWWADVNDPAAIQQMLLDAIHRTDLRTSETTAHRRPEIIARYHRRALTRQYADLLVQLTRTDA